MDRSMQRRHTPKRYFEVSAHITYPDPNLINTNTIDNDDG